MNGFEKQGLDASAFGESKDSGVFRSFDAFRKCARLSRI